MQQTATNPVTTTQKSFRLIEALKGRDGVGVTELADQLGMNKSVVHNHLNTLYEEGYIAKQDNKYRLSLKFLDLGGYTRKQMDLYSTARKKMDEFAEETGELINLMTEEMGQGVYLYRAKGGEAVDLNTYTGFRTYLHTTALGQCIMSKMSKEQQNEIINQHGLPSATDKTITDPERLHNRLEEVHQRGYVINTAERLEGLRCVAAPIEGNETVLGAVSVSVPVGRLSQERAENEMQSRIRDLANVIELEVRY